MSAPQSMSKGLVLRPSPSLLESRLMNSIVSDRDNGSCYSVRSRSVLWAIETRARKTKYLQLDPAPALTPQTIMLVPFESTHSPAEDPASPTTSDPCRLSHKHPGSLIETLRSSDVIHLDIFTEKKPIIILDTPKISYELYTDINIIGHLHERLADDEDSFLCTLTHENCLDEAPLIF